MNFRKTAWIIVISIALICFPGIILANGGNPPPHFHYRSIIEFTHFSADTLPDPDAKVGNITPPDSAALLKKVPKVRKQAVPLAPGKHIIPIGIEPIKVLKPIIKPVIKPRIVKPIIKVVH